MQPGTLDWNCVEIRSPRGISSSDFAARFAGTLALGPIPRVTFHKRSLDLLPIMIFLPDSTPDW